MSTWSLKLWQKRRLIWQQRRVAGISAPGGERDRLFAHLLQRQCCAPPTLPSAARIFSEEVHLLNASLSGHGDLAQNHRGFSDNPN
jgi:hypothetical protein